MRKGRRQRAPNHANHVPLEIRQTLEELYYRFREKFGRDTGPNDPIFFDPHSDQPAPLGREALNETWDRMADAMVRQGEITPETAYAMKKTGLLVTDQTKDLLSNAELGEWNDAVQEYRNVNATTRQADDAARLPVEDLHQFLPYQSRRLT